MRSTIFKILAAVILLTPVQVLAAAAETAPAAQQTTGDNPLLIALVSLAIILVFAIGALAVVLKQLGLAYRDKLRKDRTTAAGITSVLLLSLALLLPAGQALAQEAAAAGAAATEAAAAPARTNISGIAIADFYFIIGLICFEALIMLVLLYQISAMVRTLRGIPEKAHIPAQVLGKRLMKLLNRSVDIEQEETIMMDHEYDGIRELDNDLPPWWKYGFIATIISGFIYVGYYHFGGGPLQAQEFTIAMEKAEAEKKAYLAQAANNVDENTVTQIKEAGELTEAQGIFQTTCAACHAKDGGGNVGPNLTDEYWLHGGGIKDVFKSIKYGWPDKGMKSWQDDYSPKQIAALASYVKSLKGTKPAAPKAPQGDLFKEDGGATPTDSATTTAPIASSK